MPLSRLTQLWAKREATYATDPVTLGTDAVLVEEFDFDTEQEEYVQPMDGSTLDTMRPSVVGHRIRTITIKLQATGNSVALSAAVEPVYGRFLTACDMTATWDATPAAEKWDYTPRAQAAAAGSVCIEGYHDGLEFQMLGCRGTWSLEMPPGKPAVYTFRLRGLYSDVVETALPAPTYTYYVAPPIFRNSGFQPYGEAPATPDTFGHVRETVTLDWGAITDDRWSPTGPAASDGLAAIIHVGRQTTLRYQVEQKAANPDDWWARWQSRTQDATSRTLSWGSAAGNRHKVAIARHTISAPPKQIVLGNGTRGHDIAATVNGNAGDDSVTITCWQDAAP